MLRTVQSIGIALTIAYATLIVWIYVTQPRSIDELANAAAVQANVYHVDPVQYDLALTAFRSGQYRIAIDRFRRADPAAADPATQFLIASAHYALGKGRLYDDDTEFAAALTAVDRCLEIAPNHTYTSDEPGLEFVSADRLRERLKAGLEVTPSDLNPFSTQPTERKP